MDNIRFIKPTDLHAEMLRLRQEQQMDFLECLTGMDWGETTDKDTPDTPRGLGVVYHLESTTTGERLVVRTATLDRENAELPSVSDIWKQQISWSVKYTISTASSSLDIPTCAASTCVTTG